MGISDYDSTYLFADRIPSVHIKEVIYDPDTDGEYSKDSGKIIPHPKSIAVSQIGPKKYQLEIVESVDPKTYKVTYADIGWIITPEDQEDLTRILSYANDRWYLFFDDRVKPTKLVVDTKLPILGIENSEYRLTRINLDGKKEIISIYVDSNDKFKGDRIPLSIVDPSKPAIKLCSNCHTLSRMEVGDVITIETFNTLGMQTAEIKLIVKRAALLNDLDGQTNPIVNFDAVCTQMNGSDFYVHQRQDPSHLGITPYIDFADGTREIVPIDNQHCFIYGLDDFQPSFPGKKQKLLIKYYLQHRQKSPIVIDDGRTRYLTTEKYLTVIPDNSTYGVKLSVIPRYDPSTLSYRLITYLYTERRDKVTDVTSLVNISDFNGAVFYDFQKVTMDLDLSKIFENSLSINYRQHVWVKLFPQIDFMKYILKESSDASVAYGVESSSWKRPVIHYDQTKEQYFIPTSAFPDKDAFLEVFYYNSSPLTTDKNSYEPTTPTHFTIRDILNGQVLTASPIEVSQYNQIWNIISSPSDKLVGDSVIVEFLEFVNGGYSILYGAPVDVHTSKTGYQG